MIRPISTRSARHRPLLLLAFIAACGKGDTSPTSTIDCLGVTTTVLAVGEQAIIDPASQQGCLRLPVAGPAGAEHLVVAVSAAGQETATGVAGNFTLESTTDTFGLLSQSREALTRNVAPSEVERFDRMLRARERVYARDEQMRRPRYSGSALRFPPVVGDQRSFKVCKTASCASFVTVGATAKFVGAHGAIFLDDTVPAGGYTQGDIDSIGGLFEQYLYPIDTTAFGRESDIDGNGVVMVLLTDRINALSPNCAQNAQFIAGYFFGLDLLNDPNSNGGEVFYSAVPDPSIPVCFGKASMQRRLGGTFIHEFQHMISYNRHVLLGGGEAEETWLNEGLSHFAEELGGRLVPDAFCVAPNTCLTQYVKDDLLNAKLYLMSPESYALVEGGNSSGSLAERGANWLFVRWLADQSPTDSILGTDITRRLTGAGSAGGLTTVGGQNAAAAAVLFQPGVGFSTLVSQWHMANFAENRAGFTEPTGRLRYRSWNLAAAIDVFAPGPYPLRPDSVDGSGYATSGTLRGGSGAYLRVVQGAGGAPVALGLRVNNSGAVAPRYAVVRLR
jgi:hypothetical protein